MREVSEWAPARHTCAIAFLIYAYPHIAEVEVEVEVESLRFRPYIFINAYSFMCIQYTLSIYSILSPVVHSSSFSGLLHWTVRLKRLQLRILRKIVFAETGAAVAAAVAVAFVLAAVAAAVVATAAVAVPPVAVVAAPLGSPPPLLDVLSAE